MAGEGWWARFRETAAHNALYEVVRAATFFVGAWLIVEGGWREVFPPYDKTSALTLLGASSVAVGIALVVQQVRGHQPPDSKRDDKGETGQSPSDGVPDEKWGELVGAMREILADRSYWDPTVHERGNVHRLTTDLSREVDEEPNAWLHFEGIYNMAIRDLDDLFEMYSHPSNEHDSTTFWSSYLAYKGMITLILKMGYALEELRGSAGEDIPDSLNQEYSEFRSFFERLRQQVDDLDRRMKIEVGEEFDTLWP